MSIGIEKTLGRRESHICVDVRFKKKKNPVEILAHNYDAILWNLYSCVRLFFHLSGHKVQGDRSSFDGKLPFTFWWLFVLFHCAVLNGSGPLSIDSPSLTHFLFCEKKKKKKKYVGEREKLFWVRVVFKTGTQWSDMLDRAKTANPHIQLLLYLCYFIQEKKRERELHGGGY